MSTETTYTDTSQADVWRDVSCVHLREPTRGASSVLTLELGRTVDLEAFAGESLGGPLHAKVAADCARAQRLVERWEVLTYTQARAEYDAFGTEPGAVATGEIRYRNPIDGPWQTSPAWQDVSGQWWSPHPTDAKRGPVRVASSDVRSVERAPIDKWDPSKTGLETVYATKLVPDPLDVARARWPNAEIVGLAHPNAEAHDVSPFDATAHRVIGLCAAHRSGPWMGVVAKKVAPKAKLIPWATVQIWDGGEWGWSDPVSYDNASRDGTSGDRAQVLRMLREYRDTGGIAGAYLVDPSDYDDDDDSACVAGPKVDEIDWTGIDEAAKEFAA